MRRRARIPSLLRNVTARYRYLNLPAAKCKSTAEQQEGGGTAGGRGYCGYLHSPVRCCLLTSQRTRMRSNAPAETAEKPSARKRALASRSQCARPSREGALATTHGERYRRKSPSSAAARSSPGSAAERGARGVPGSRGSRTCGEGRRRGEHLHAGGGALWSRQRSRGSRTAWAVCSSAARGAPCGKHPIRSAPYRSPPYRQQASAGSRDGAVMMRAPEGRVHTKSSRALDVEKR